MTQNLDGFCYAVRSVVSDAVDLVYPPRCIVCKGMASQRVPLCMSCCQSLDRPLVDEVIRHIAAKNPEPAVDAAFALWIFEKNGPVQQIHRELKYGNRPYYGEIMGRIAGREMRESGGAQFDLIVPIPLHRSRFHDRGYNQSETIALGIQSILEMPLDANALIRTRRTRSQTGLSMSSRLENVENAFGVGRNPVPVGANVLLVDDIITTGSTVCSAARVLKESGVRSVTVAGVGFARV